MATAVPVVADTPDPEAETVVVEIDLEDLEDDRRDPEWQAFLQAAKAYRQRLRLEGRVR